MKNSTFNWLIFGLLVIVSTLININVSKPLDFQMYDTYFVLDSTLWLIILGPSCLITFLILGVIRKFKSTSTNLLLITGLLFTSLIFIWFIRTEYLLSNYAKEQYPNHNDFSMVHYEILLPSWIIVITCALFILTLGFKTIRLLRLT